MRLEVRGKIELETGVRPVTADIKPADFNEESRPNQ